MDVKLVIFAFLVLAALIMSAEAGKRKKVVIHVPYKVKKIKHTHTIYKTIHHHHNHGHGGHGSQGSQGGHGGHGGQGGGHMKQDENDEHEHFHHQGEMHGHHSQMHPVYVMPSYKHTKTVPMFHRQR